MTASQNGKLNFDQWLTSTVRALIGRQRPPVTLDKLAEALTEKLPSELRQHKEKIVRHEILEKFKEILQEGVNDSVKILQDAAAARMPAEKVYALLKRHAHKDAPDFPQWVVEDLITEMRGRVKVPHTKLESALSGINRLQFMEATDRTFAQTSYKKPYHALKDVKSDKLKISVISGMQFGLPYDQDIHLNLVRCGFSASRKLGCDAIVVGGGLLHMELKKRAGPNRLVNDMLSGHNIDFASFAEDYQEEVKRIVESKSLDPIFQTVEEEFLNVLLRGLQKVMLRPGRDGKGPVKEFDNPVYVILNANDLEVPKAAAHFHLLYKQMQRYHEALAVMREKAKEVAVYEKILNPKKKKKKDEDLDDEKKSKKLSAEDLRQTRLDWEAAKLASARATAAATRFRMSNLHKAQNKKVLKRAISYVVQKIEEAANCTVISSGGAFVRFGANDHILHFVSSTKSVHVKRLKSYGPDQRRDELADLTVSMHPGAVYPRKGSRENYKIAGKLLGTASFFEAPILVDQAPLLEALEGFDVKIPVVSAVKDEMFQGGMGLISLDNRFMPDAQSLSAEAVRYNGQPKVAKRAPAKYVYDALWTDWHISAANRNWLRTREGVPIGVLEAGCELMMRSGMDKAGRAYVFGMTVADDLTQGNHFGTHLRPHHNARPSMEMSFEAQDELKRIEASTAKDREAAKDKLLREYIDQMTMFHPAHHWGTQLKNLHVVLDRYERLFKGMLLRARDSGVVVQGISSYNRFNTDARDIGLINFGSGNHATKTVDGAVFEGELVADRLRVALRNDPDLSGMDMRKVICGPMFQDQSIGFGIMQIGEKGPVWGVHVAGTPPKRDSWYDLTHGWTQVNRQRGDVSTIFRKIPIIHKTGDKHFFSMDNAGGDTKVMGPSSTHTDAFADIAGGLPENNAGLCFIGYPVDGQDRAPVIAKHLTPKTIQDFLTSGEPFPWEDFLPNRA